MIREQICKLEQDFKPKLKLLPNTFKRIGWTFAVLSFIGFLGVKMMEVSDLEGARVILRQSLILSFFVIAISRDQIEDELIEKLRTYSFALAFILGVLYAFVQPYVNYALDLMLGSSGSVFEPLSSFGLLSFMLLIYLGFFESFKRKR